MPQHLGGDRNPCRLHPPGGVAEAKTASAREGRLHPSMPSFEAEPTRPDGRTYLLDSPSKVARAVCGASVRAYGGAAVRSWHDVIEGERVVGASGLSAEPARALGREHLGPDAAVRGCLPGAN